MADAITIKALQDASLDAKSLEEVVNGDAVTTVLSRLGESYPTLANALNQIDGQISDANDMLVESVTTLFENGGLPATPFATKVLMTASVLVDGDYAMVTDDTVNNGLYVKTAGAWVKSSYDPVAAANSNTDEKLDSYLYLKSHFNYVAGGDTAFGVIGNYGFTPFNIKADGTTRIDTLEITNSIQLPTIVNDKLDVIQIHTDKNTPWAVVDKYGMTPIKIDSDGALHVSDIKSVNKELSIFGSMKSQIYDARYLKPVVDLGAERHVLLSYGQSLSIGASSGTPYNTTQKYNAVMFNTGVITRGADLSKATELIPAVEGLLVDGSTPISNETPLSGASNMIYRLLEDENGMRTEDTNYEIFLAATGQGSTGISGLSSNQGYYQLNLQVLDKVVSFSQETGVEVAQYAWFWTQGETDYGVKTSYENYKARLTQLIADLNSDIKVKTGQGFDPVCIGYQTKNPDSLVGVPSIGLAQWDLSRESNNYIVACPLYQLEQPMHPNTFGYILMGAYYGLAYKRIIFDKVDWKPLEPTHAETKNNNYIYVTFNVPVGNLVLDETTLKNGFSNQGFSVIDAVGSEYTIEAVTLAGSNKVKIKTSEPVASGSEVRYGYNGGGHLRDTQGEYIEVDVGGYTMPLHNWCLVSRIAVSN